MTLLPAPKSTLSPGKSWLRLLTVVGMCSLAAALPKVLPTVQTTSFSPLSLSLESLTELSPLSLPVSLPTGTQITPPVGSGYSQLTVKNGNPVDAVFKLVDIPSGQTLRFMYVQANDTLTVDDLGTCTCDLRFATGIDWDVEQQRFRRGMALSAFSDPAEFAITIKDNREYWSTLEVTLHPVVGGNAQTETLSEDEF
jgi:hypothetical protein